MSNNLFKKHCLQAGFNMEHNNTKVITTWKANYWLVILYLQAMSQVAISIRKIRFKFQSSAVRSYSFWNISRILEINSSRAKFCPKIKHYMLRCTYYNKWEYLVNGSQIAVGICKCRVNLNGTGVTLQGSLDILHLL